MFPFQNPLVPRVMSCVYRILRRVDRTDKPGIFSTLEKLRDDGMASRLKKVSKIVQFNRVCYQLIEVEGVYRG
jgi:hypothetical protein